jgi:hypothetical protein
MRDEVHSGSGGAETTWLSGAILTFLSKVVMPTLWMAVLFGVPAWVLFTRGQISIRSDFQFIVWGALLATVPLTWFTVHLQSVGYRGRELVVKNYWRVARVPFEHVEAVEPVWWYKGRVVRIRFNRRTPFGSVVYYMPKWGPMLAMVTSPEEELRRVIAERESSMRGNQDFE